jgi:uncharacterized protein YecE (DUF72 family)
MGTPPKFDLEELRFGVAALAERGIYIGTSSWKYRGWLGMIYTPSRYEYRGKFANTRFERDCLREYAETFKTVCFDGAYYGWLDEAKLGAMAEQVPPDFRFAFKVTDTITIKRFPSLPRFGPAGGTLNEHFLDAPLFCERFLQPLESIRQNVGPIIFEFSKFYPAEYSNGSDFVADLDKFFSQLPKGWSYSAELRNRTWLGPEYLACLRKHDVAHVFNSWTDMPSVNEQLQIVGEQQGDDAMTVARFLLKPGRKYEEAVQRFQPYTETKEVNDDARCAVAAMIDRGWLKLKATRRGEYLYINNRLEGNALNTVHGVLATLGYLVELERGKERAYLPKPSPRPRTETPQLDLGI